MRAAGDLVASLAEVLSDARVSTAAAQLEQHAHGESYHRLGLPDVVVWPESTQEVAAVVAVCRDDRVPMIPFGSGTSLEGHVCPSAGGVCLDLTRMNAIRRVSVEDLDATVEAGVTRLQLDERLRRDGVFFPVDPGANATIGGMIATGASGTTTVRYGAMRENVISLTVVTAAGEIVRTRSRARKSSAGYDLTRLFIGSEGTLGVITEAVLRVHPTPECRASAMCAFDSVEGAVACVVDVMQQGVAVSRIELLDTLQVRATEQRTPVGLALSPTLLIEVEGTAAEVAEKVEAVEAAARESGASKLEPVTDTKRQRELWNARHHAFEAALALRPGSVGLATDACVPISQLARCIAETQADIAASGVTAPIVGHVGDGNFHLLLVLDPENGDELEAARSLASRLAHRAIELDGTCTGEHGVGFGKAPYLVDEFGEAGVRMMRAIKDALDPDGIMNPGKVVPA